MRVVGREALSARCGRRTAIASAGCSTSRRRAASTSCAICACNSSTASRRVSSGSASMRSRSSSNPRPVTAAPSSSSAPGIEECKRRSTPWRVEPRLLFTAQALARGLGHAQRKAGVVSTRQEVRKEIADTKEIAKQNKTFFRPPDTTSRIRPLPSLRLSRKSTAGARVWEIGHGADAAM